ncbi:MAG: phosphopantothenoylcysteine decarboxylase [Sedimentisphaerales bacterium]|nr:phosphopantothenoylcysteine decarboxylase [Sedimentisphaerales bacterium]
MKNGKKMRFLITAGGTREYLDPVRYITNASSGRMGYALAAAALKAGHSVTLISAPTGLVPPAGAEVVSVVSAGDMFKAVKKHFKTCDCLIMAAAVSDYTPVEAAKVKRKKEKKILTLKLKPTEDILAWAGRHKKQNVVVGFALEDRNLKRNAEKKLISKNADMIVANSPAAIGADSSRVLLKTPQGSWIDITGDKAKTARAIIRHITSLILG